MYRCAVKILFYADKINVLPCAYTKLQAQRTRDSHATFLVGCRMQRIYCVIKQKVLSIWIEDYTIYMENK